MEAWRANSLATGLEAGALLILMRKRLDGMHGRRILDATIRGGLASLSMGVALWWWNQAAQGMSAWIVALGGVVIGVLVYVGAVLALGVPEVRALGGWLLHKVRT
jgi:putative peptidoglycan lipid II flippase